MKISKELKVGSIVIITVIVFFALFKFLQGQDIFHSGRVFYVKYDNVDGLLPTKPVNINGLRVGKVDDIIIKEDKDSIYFLVKMTVNEDVKFTKNTVAEIYEPGVLAGKMIQLNLSYEGELAQSGDTLKASHNQSLIDLVTEKIKPTQNKLDSVLLTLNTSLGRFNRIADEDTNQSLKAVLKSLDKSLNAITETAISIKMTSQQAGNLVNNANSKFGEITQNTNEMVKTTNQTISKYGDVADKLNNSKLDETLLELNGIATSLKTTLDRIEKADGTLNKVINDKELYENLNKTASNLNLLIGELKDNPDKYMQFSVFGKKAKK